MAKSNVLPISGMLKCDILEVVCAVTDSWAHRLFDVPAIPAGSPGDALALPKTLAWAVYVARIHGQFEEKLAEDSGAWQRSGIIGAARNAHRVADHQSEHGAQPAQRRGQRPNGRHPTGQMRQMGRTAARHHLRRSRRRVAISKPRASVTASWRPASATRRRARRLTGGAVWKAAGCGGSGRWSRRSSPSS